DKVEEYFRSNQVEKYYLYTDDGSNYGFYDHMGMAKIAETPISFRPYEAGDIHLYLYEKIF
ncbi:MAG: N-acetyltransferase, partial [Clostridia bacterium]